MLTAAVLLFVAAIVMAIIAFVLVVRGALGAVRALYSNEYPTTTSIMRKAVLLLCMLVGSPIAFVLSVFLLLASFA